MIYSSLSLENEALQPETVTRKSQPEGTLLLLRVSQLELVRAATRDHDMSATHSLRGRQRQPCMRTQ